jgi:hypothetical protein
MIKSRQIHPVWLDWTAARGLAGDSYFPPCFVDKYQWIYTSNKGRVSLVRLTDEFYSRRAWELCGSGLTPDGPERYATQEEAEKRISELLD